MKNIIVTGAAGFIGSSLVDKLLNLDAGINVYNIDNFDNYYKRELKEKNIESALKFKNYHLMEKDILDTELVETLKQTGIQFDTIVHLAAKAGVRPSILNPRDYQEVNVIGTQNMLDIAKELGIKQFVFASSSSVYGVNPNYPWSESDNVLKPISPYAASKISGELLGSVYSYLYGIRFIALRFFTVFGPRQRPDLAINKFVNKIVNGEQIDFYGDGSTKRDYTYVGDIIDGIIAAMNYDKTLYEIINLGNNTPTTLNELVEIIEEVVGKKAIKNIMPMQEGDVPVTFADINKAKQLLNYSPKVKVAEGIKNFADWYLN